MDGSTVQYSTVLYDSHVMVGPVSRFFSRLLGGGGRGDIFFKEKSKRAWTFF